jgi:hypothetical protein
MGTTPPSTDKRTAHRATAELRAIVITKDYDGIATKEIIEVTTISRNGAGFNLSHECIPGQLVNLVLPMPDDMRAYDHGQKLYPVIGLVQYCNLTSVEGKNSYQIGVGFIGKEVPESYKANPMQSYRISGMTTEGLWAITEAGRAFKPRKNPRFWLSLNVSISLIQKDIKSISKEETVTQNVSASGVAVFSQLDAKPGDRVKFACKDVDFYTMAVVKEYRTPAKEQATLHLEFIDESFPMDKIFQPKQKEPVDSWAVTRQHLANIAEQAV